MTTEMGNVEAVAARIRDTLDISLWLTIMRGIVRGCGYPASYGLPSLFDFGPSCAGRVGSGVVACSGGESHHTR